MDELQDKKSGFYLFKLFGFEVRIDSTWFILAVLIVTSLATLYFPSAFKGLSKNTYWIMGVFGALGLFFSIILHELSHSLVGYYYGLPITGIKLFIFGGIAEMGEEPRSAKAEFLMSMAGPFCSILLGILLLFLFHFGVTVAHWPSAINGVVQYLGAINILLGAFNLFPGYPLDGGRVLHSFLWWWTKDLEFATRIASRCGIGMGIGLMLLGALFFIKGVFISGIWSLLIGIFIYRLAKMSYQDFLIKAAFKDEHVRKYTSTNPITVSPNLSLQELVDTYFHQQRYKLYPVVDNDKLLGGISLNEVRHVPKEKWSELTIGDILPNMYYLLVDAETPVMEVLKKMYSLQLSRLIVTDKDTLYGVITLKDLMHIVAMKMNINDNELE